MTPVERAAEALHTQRWGSGYPTWADADRGIKAVYREDARATFESINVDELARVIDLHREDYDSDCGMYYGCHCGWDNGTEENNNGYAEHVARELKEHLTKGDENDE